MKVALISQTMLISVKLSRPQDYLRSMNSCGEAKDTQHNCNWNF